MTDSAERAPARVSLPMQLLVLTVIFVLVAEAFVFVFSIGKFRIDWLRDRVEAGQIAVLAQEAHPDHMIEYELMRELLSNAEVEAVTLQRDDTRELVLMRSAETDLVPGVVDLDNFNPAWETIRALITFFADDHRMLVIVGTPRLDAGGKIEATVPLGPLKREMWTYAGNILVLSLGIAIFTAGCVYWALTEALVRPMTRLTLNMRSFQSRPEDASRIMRPSGRADEIGDAEAVLADMQTQLHAALKRKQRLAALGAGVSKINHDLRNVLASAQLISDRMAASDDPLVAKLAPRLLRSIDRAVGLCRDTLAYGRLDETRLSIEATPLRPLVADAALDAAPEGGPVRTVIDIDEARLARVDREQFHRVLLNLFRNAVQVMNAMDGEREKVLRISAQTVNDRTVIDIADSGPGVPDSALDKLFTPFAGSTTAGGSGLGLAIADEIVRAHGGALTLHRSDETGAVFRITLPN